MGEIQNNWLRIWRTNVEVGRVAASDLPVTTQLYPRWVGRVFRDLKVAEEASSRLAKVPRHLVNPQSSAVKPTLHQSPSTQTELAPGMLSNFVESSQPWSRVRVAVAGRLRWTLWSLLFAELFWAIWLATIVAGAISCRGPICTVATLDHHAAALLACGVFCIAVLVALIPATRGFSKCNGTEVIGLSSAAAAGGTALLGLAALITGVLIVMLLFATLVLASTATSRRETDHERTGPPYPIALVEAASRPRAR
jgi:hypothetical protein